MNTLEIMKKQQQSYLNEFGVLGRMMPAVEENSLITTGITSSRRALFLDESEDP